MAPVRSAAEVAPLCEAGADELYCGVAPSWWEERYGGAWASRRDPRAAGVADLGELDRIVSLAGNRPVHVALNAARYPDGAVGELAEFGRHLLREHGVSALIVADLELILTLTDQGLGPRLHVSSLATVTNGSAAAFFRELGASRVILPRHLTLPEIRACLVPGLEYEVFLLNDGCVFEEGLCATTHALGPFCLGDGPGTEGVGARALEEYELWKWTLSNCGCRTSRGYPLAPCGLCALPAFRRMGITSLKVVGREASPERKRASVDLAARAVRLAEAGGEPDEIREAVVALRGARSLCDGAHGCYYPGVWHRGGRGAPGAVPC
ncbi:MAG: U32 family peptidase [Deferrisomatales bacterium]|nr:U32 family peptidase [Deferrisomatales bacterium]